MRRCFRWTMLVGLALLAALTVGAILTSPGSTAAQGASPSAAITCPPASPAASPGAVASPGASPAVGTPTPCGTPGVGSTGPVTAVTVKLVDIAFQPNAVTIPAHTAVAVTLTNAGSLPHNFSIDALHVSVDVAPGQTKQVTIDAPAGTYQYYCNVPGHKEAGMVGTLTVK